MTKFGGHQLAFFRYPLQSTKGLLFVVFFAKITLNKVSSIRHCLSFVFAIVCFWQSFCIRVKRNICVKYWKVIILISRIIPAIRAIRLLSIISSEWGKYWVILLPIDRINTSYSYIQSLSNLGCYWMSITQYNLCRLLRLVTVFQ